MHKQISLNLTLIEGFLDSYKFNFKFARCKSCKPSKLMVSCRKSMATSCRLAPWPACQSFNHISDNPKTGIPLAAPMAHYLTPLTSVNYALLVHSLTPFPSVYCSPMAHSLTPFTSAYCSPMAQCPYTLLEWSAPLQSIEPFQPWSTHPPTHPLSSP